MKKLMFILLLLIGGSAQAYDCTSAFTPQGMIRDGSCTNNVLMKVNADGSVPITGAVSTTPAVPVTSGPTSITSTQCSTLSNLQSQAVVMVDVSGTYTGSLVARAIGPASTTGIFFRPRANGVAGSYTLTAQTGLFTIDTAGATSVQVCGSTVATGTAVVSLRTNTGAEDSLDPLMKLPGTAASPSVYLISTVPTPASGSASGIAGIPSTALESSHVLKSSAGNLYGLIVTNGASGPTSGYVQIFNATSAPADGAVTPRQCFAAPPPGQSAAYGAIIVPDYYSTGITVVLSSAADCLTKTASAFAFFTGKVQ